MRSLWVHEFLLDRHHELIIVLSRTNAPESRAPLLARLNVLDDLLERTRRGLLDAREFEQLLTAISAGSASPSLDPMPFAVDEATELLRRWPQWIERVA